MTSIRFHEGGIGPRLPIAILARLLIRLVALCARPASGSRFLRKPLKDFAPKAILVLRLDGIGDAILTVPLLRALRSNYPEAEITLAVGAAVPLFRECPYIDRIVEVPRPRWYRLGGVEYIWPALRLARRAFRHQHFDLAINPRWQADDYFAALVALICGADRRLAFSERATSDAKVSSRSSLDALYTDTVPRTIVGHELDQGLSLLRSLGIKVEDSRLELWPSIADDQQVAGILPGISGEQNALPIAVAPGVSEACRAWPEKNFVDLCRRLRDDYKAHIFLVGGINDAALAARIAAELDGDATSVAGHMTLRETAALVRRCALFIGNDSAPMHIAAAVGTAVVEISCHPADGDDAHPRSPLRFGPRGVLCEVLRPARGMPPCVDACVASEPHCIGLVTVDNVMEAAERLLAVVKVTPHLEQPCSKTMER